MVQLQPLSHCLPCPVVFISTAYGEQRDIMTATATFIAEEEPLLAVSLVRGHLTAELISRAGGFTLVIASVLQKELVWQVGGTKGSEGNKFERFAIKTLPPQPGKPLIPEGAACYAACSVVSRQEMGGHMLFIARAVEWTDLNNPPLVWYRNALFTLADL